MPVEKIPGKYYWIGYSKEGIDQLYIAQWCKTDQGPYGWATCGSVIGISENNPFADVVIGPIELPYYLFNNRVGNGY